MLTGILPALWWCIVGIERKVRVARCGEVVHRKRVEELARLELRWRGALAAELGQAIGDEEDKHDEQAVGRALDLEVTEE